MAVIPHAWCKGHFWRYCCCCLRKRISPHEIVAAPAVPPALRGVTEGLGDAKVRGQVHSLAVQRAVLLQPRARQVHEPHVQDGVKVFEAGAVERKSWGIRAVGTAPRALAALPDFEQRLRDVPRLEVGAGEAGAPGLQHRQGDRLQRDLMVPLQQQPLQQPYHVVRQAAEAPGLLQLADGREGLQVVPQCGEILAVAGREGKDDARATNVPRSGCQRRDEYIGTGWVALQSVLQGQLSAEPLRGVHSSG